MDFSLLSSLLHAQVHDAEERADRLYEAVIGKVVNNTDPDGLSRVKVHIPILGGEDETWWAPLAALGAGKDRGWYFLPEVDDEVVVMFVHGDISRPVVIGALWNGNDVAPDENGGGNERKTIVSRAGSKIILDDDEGTITLEDGNGDGTIVIADDKITIESATGDVCLQAPKGEMSVVANEIKATGSMNCHVESQSGGLNIGGDAAVTIKGGTGLKVQGTAVQLQPGSASAAAEATDSCESVDDPLE